MEKGDDASRPERLTAANDNGSADDSAQADAAATRIAEAIGRHIAHQHIPAHKAANDNGGEETA